MLEMGIIVAIGLLVTLAKLSWRRKLWMTSHTLFMDVAVFVGLTLVHWGTFSGVMVATIGALFCSITLSLARKVIGHIENGKYVRGWMDVSTRI
jgi:ascorbate-specific PTS system EIIC-type component UlaA